MPLDPLTRRRALPQLACALALAWSGVSAAADDTSLCQAALAQVRALPPLDPGHGAQDLVYRLAEGPHPFLSLDDRSATAEAAAAQVAAFIDEAEHHGASPETLAAMRAMKPDEGEIRLQRLGASSLRAIGEDQGTAHCQDFVIVDAPAGGPVRLLPQPPQAQAKIDAGEEPTAFCFDESALAGAADGHPAFIVETALSAYPAYDLNLSTWTGQRWSRPCAFAVAYRPVYRVQILHCRGALCAPLRTAAPAIAAAFVGQRHAHPDADRVSLTWGPPPRDKAKVQALRAFTADSVPDLEEPTLGDPGGQPLSFGDDRTALPVTLAGHTYLAVVGAGHIGWRVFPTVIVALYDLKAGDLVPVAAAEVEQRQGPLAAAQLRPWPGP